MSFEGYFKLGETEIVNAARAAKYVGSLMPNFGLDDCTDCDGVANATGVPEYRSPIVDTAPWIDSSNPALDDFWGVYPLSVEGLDDSTRETTVTQLTGDGSVASRPRAASREIRFDVLLVGRTKQAVDEGFLWLNRALDAQRCEGETLGCTGTELEFFASCPPECDYSNIVNTIVDWAGLEAADIQRTNLSPNPRGFLHPNQGWGGGGVVGSDWVKGHAAQPTEVLHPRIGRRNYATNPSFEHGAAGTVDTAVVVTNLAAPPQPVAGSPGINPYAHVPAATGTGGAVTTGVGNSPSTPGRDVFRVRWTTAPSEVTTTDLARRQNIIPVTAGLWYGGLISTVIAGGITKTMALRFQWLDSSGAGIPQTSGPEMVVGNTETWLSAVAQAPTGAVNVRIDIDLVAPITPWVVDSGYDLRESLVVEGFSQAEVQAAVNLGYFDGSKGAGDGLFFVYLDAHWTGTPFESTSVLVPKGAAYPQAVAPEMFDVAGTESGPMATSQAAQPPTQSTYGQVSGAMSVAVVPAGDGGAVSVVYPANGFAGSTVKLGFQPGATYTVSGYITLKSPQESANLSPQARGIRVRETGDGTYGLAQAPNVAGTHRVSITFTVPATVTGDVILELINGSDLPTDLVWWDDILIEETAELGPYFDGNSVLPYSTNSWVGTANDSVSREVAYTDAVVNYHPNPRYVGENDVTGGTGGDVIQEDLLADGPDGGGFTRVTLGQNQTSNIFIGGENIVLSGLIVGEQYVPSVHIRVPTTGTLDVRIAFLNSEGAQVLQQIATAPAVADTWVRIATSPVTVPRSATEWRIVATVRSDNALTAGQTMDVGCRMMQHGAALTAYFDGTSAPTDFTDFFWSDGAHASPSISSDAVFAPPTPLRESIGFQWANAVWVDGTGAIFALHARGGEGDGWRADVEAGESYGVGLWMYVPEPTPVGLNSIQLRCSWRDDANEGLPGVGDFSVDTGPTTPGWHYLEGNTGPAPAGAALLSVFPWWVGSSQTVLQGQAIAWAQRVIENVDTTPGAYFDGSTDSDGSDGVVTWWSSNQFDPEAISYLGTVGAGVTPEVGYWSIKSAYGIPGGPEWTTESAGTVCDEPMLSIRGSVESTGIPNSLRMTRRLDNLTVGAWYRVSVSAYGNLSEQNFSSILIARASIRGTEAATTGTSTDSGYPCLSDPMAPMVFQATSCVAYLDVTTTADSSGFGGADATDGDLALYVSSLSVTRVSGEALAYRTEFPTDGTYFNGWTHDMPTDLNLVVERQGSIEQGGGTALRMAPGTSTAVPVGTVVATRVVRGLTPGNTYQVAMVVEPNAGATVDLTLSATSGASTTSVTQTATQFESERLTVDLVADSNEVTISLALASAVDVSTVDGLIYFRSAYVEDVTRGAPPLPDLTRDLQRTLYRVTALTGPTKAELYDKTCGYMLRATFGLVAGIPNHIGPLVEAGQAIGGTGVPFQDTACINGEPIRYNLVPTPSFENETVVNDKWRPIVIGDNTVSSIESGSALFGSRVLALGIEDSAAFSIGTYLLEDTADAYPESFPTTTLSAYMQWSIPISVPNMFGGLGMQFLDAAGQTISFVNDPSITQLTAGEWTRIEMTFAAPAGAVTVIPFLYANNGGFDWPLGQLLIDGAMLELGGRATEYFDGDSSPRAAWLTTPNNGPSWYIPPQSTEVVDPDCPPLPTPPAPPSIDETCVEIPSLWTRYAIRVPQDMIPLFASVLPVVTIRTGDVEARSVRMRWYPNLDGGPASALPPCDFEGEVIVSYMPPNAEMVVDGIAHTATVYRDGVPPSPSTHLLYGPDGGPMIWPELRCNQDYIFTVDVDPTGDVSQLDVLLSLGLKV